jgi:tRNA G18 (ribose-2'-O)-methylase SpoU
MEASAVWKRHTSRLIKDSKYRLKMGSSIVSNRHVLEEIPSSIIKRLAAVEEEPWLSKKADFTICKSDINKIIGCKSNDGILAEIATPITKTISHLPKGHCIFLPAINDPVNLGLIARTAWCLGCHLIIDKQGCCDPFGFKAIASSRGAVLKDGLISRMHLKDATRQAKDIFLADLESNIPHQRFHHKISLGPLLTVCTREPRQFNWQDCAFIFGSESHGHMKFAGTNLPSNFHYISINCRGSASLNVAIAMSIIVSSVKNL